MNVNMNHAKGIELVKRLIAWADVAAWVVETSADLHQDPQLKHRNHFWAMDHRELGRFSYFEQAAVLSETPAQPRMPSPFFGEHSEQVCKEILEMPETEFDELLVEGVFD